MFKEARIKLTTWYLAIIMAISIFFSLIIYRGATFEIARIQRVQILRRPFNSTLVIDTDIVNETKERIILWLAMINSSILAISAIAGYFLAGKTLEPIKKNMEEQKEFVSNASHELRTPLTSLKTEIEVSLRDKGRTPAGLRDTLKSNLEDVNKMQELSNYLLKLNRYEEGGKLPMSKVDLKEVVLQAAGRRKVKVNLKRSFVNGNKDALIELVSILIDNAFKHGGGKEMEIRTKDGTIEVEDHGAGIAESDLPHIFDRFFRSQRAAQIRLTGAHAAARSAGGSLPMPGADAGGDPSTFHADGSGLGLSIAQAIVRAHRGTIAVSSQPGAGTTFTVSLPAT